MTLLSRAKVGLGNKELKEVANHEGLELDRLLRGILTGRIVIPANPIHAPKLVAIGEGTSVKINVNIGTSPDHIDIKEEIDKARVSILYGADTIMDLSTGGDVDEIRKRIVRSIGVPIGTVPIYQAGLECARKGSVVDMTEDQIFNGIEKHAKMGVDFMTVHCGVTRHSVARLKKCPRTTGIVSRGGSFISAWMDHNEKENPLYSNYDYLLELAKKYEFCLSLGDGLRPGSTADATDRGQVEETLILGELVERARASGVQTMVEGPGHVPLDQIEANVRIEKTLCKGAPFYVLGPLVTDIAPGYDHIVGAIGGTLAAYYGADFLCYVTPSEHLSLPTIEDVIEGTVASKIAAHAADLARGRGIEWDAAMSKARKARDWDAQFKLCIDPVKARAYRERRAPAKEDTCSMCGELCAMRIGMDCKQTDKSKNKKKAIRAIANS